MFNQRSLTNMTSTQTIALVGGTGRLGKLIGNALLDKGGVRLQLLIRPGSGSKAADLVQRGALPEDSTFRLPASSSDEFDEKRHAHLDESVLHASLGLPAFSDGSRSTDFPGN
jgi:hypothetical protein